MIFYTYILFSEKFDKFYVGHTNDLDRRITEHNSGFSKSTKAAIPWKLVLSKSFASKSEAYAFERKIKSMKSRKFILDLINSI
jgi:putative endonuclease